MKIKLPTNSLWFKSLFVLLASFLALIFAFISITNNPILIGLAVGVVLGVFLLTNPKITIWLVLILGLATPALLDMIGHGMSRMLWAVSMLALLLWIPGIFNLISINPRQSKLVPAFVWAAVIFAFYAVMVTLSQLHSTGELFGGFKRYFQAFGLMLTLVVAYSRQDFDNWLKVLLYVALLQLPFALFERFILVPLRGGLAAGGEATDIVAGTMGANMDGGSPNAIMVLFVLIAWGFVLARWKEKLIRPGKVLMLSLLLLLPLALGETKVVIVLLPLVGVVLFSRDFWRDPVRFLPLVLGMAALTIALAYLYIYVMLDSTFVQAFRGMWAYNVNEVGYGNLLLNRTTAFTFWMGLHGWHDPISLLFGHGLGSSYGSGLDAGHVAQLSAVYPEDQQEPPRATVQEPNARIPGLCHPRREGENARIYGRRSRPPRRAGR